MLFSNFRSAVRVFSRRAYHFKLGLATAILMAIFLYLSHDKRTSLSWTPLPPLSYELFFQGLDEYVVKAPSLKDRYKADKVESRGSNQDEFLFSKEYLENVLDISDETLQLLKQSHHGYVHKHMDNLIKESKIATFGIVRPESPEWKTYKKSAGYVIIGGGKYSWLSYLVVKQIRSIGGTLPIEVFIPSEKEYEEKFCKEVLPKYDAVCNVLDVDVMKSVAENFKIGGYQFKMLAILTSKFENVMYLDSDLFPTRNPEYIFDSDLYKEKGLLLWPDHWARTTNPKFHEIAEYPVLETKVRYSKYDKKQAESKGESLKPLSEFTFKDSNFHDFQNALPDPSSEAGILVVNKTSHLRTMLLALYYNLLGPDYYYPLMTQGGAGEGDKETFIAAASVMGEPYHQTAKSFAWVGYHSQDEKSFVSKALGHYDPLVLDPEAPNNITFLHCSYPKYYTDWFYNNHDLIYKDEKTHIRMYEGIYNNVGYDVDLKFQQNFVQGVCKGYYKDGKAVDSDIREEDEWAGNFLKYIGDDLEANNKRCAEVYLPHLKWLKETTKFPNTLTQ
ncbi:Alpha-1,2-mannosyltransferase MNN2 [Clavispora lusitaniae]|uniref:Alpha-1,2-mannosyltransferase n=1 Tax=Clavispora lusitaniae (strain ATCC 42720) TaxID=306902 RepID=C4XZI2_CLAL4|nr:uncharacterized protein CLUG_01364 [Clavispora lusitaniae ATCC 42720]EEQ37241.1 hypothetical protein CLUG_01364 [Clavispora lusitaniae ATCC 42720]KAF5212364.1 hypothetical protein E0198_001927 [Clavispora lusitaniae]KAF7583780.1 Alpha-1,2-mannosyltransferase MNN2 [Clavispora lusitaniae]